MNNQMTQAPYLEPLSEGQRMAAEGRLTDRQRQTILQELEEVRITTRPAISLTKMGQLLGINRAILSRLRHGTYDGHSDKYLRIIERWLIERRDRVEVPASAYVATSIGSRIITVCEIACDLPCVGIVKTPSGWGKTAALAEMARRRGPQQCIYIQAGEACVSKREMLVEIARRIGVTLKARFTTADLYRDVRAVLAGRYQGGRGSSYLIIVDEATTLRPDAINMLRNLHDDTACRPAIVLADTVSRLDGFLYGRGGIAGGNEQLRSRSKAKYTRAATHQIDPGDVKLVADSCLKGLGFKGRLHASSYRYLTDLANEPGALRNVTARLENLYYFAMRKSLRPDYTAMQLDWIGLLSGDDWKMSHDHNAIPFGKIKVA